MAPYQYAEGLRRGIDLCRKLSSVNDGALWIKRITATNFSQAAQIVDWRHASDHLWAVANAVCGEHSAQARQWTDEHLDRLWNGQVAAVVTTLDSMDLQQERWPALVREAPDYFRSNQERMRYDVFRQQALPIGSGTVGKRGQYGRPSSPETAGTRFATRQWPGHVGRPERVT